MAVAAASLAAAAAAGLAAGRVLSRERARSAARVSALELMAAEAEDAGRRAPVLDAVPPNQMTPGLFGAHEAPAFWGKRLAAAACAAALLAAGLFAAASASPDGTETAAADAVPLQLVALRHTRAGDRLTISGIVQNPAAAPPLDGVRVTAHLFGPEGSAVASGGAPVDLTTLSPGGESPFVVSFRVTGDVSRYRVGFRDAGGRVLPHVDSRLPDGGAGSQEQP